MTLTEFSEHETRQMLQAIQGWLSSQEDSLPETGYARLDADAAESLGSGFGLDKPSSHRLLIDLTQEDYLDAECHTSESEVTPLRYAEVRSLTEKAIREIS